MKKRVTILSLLVLVAMVLGACTPAATVTVAPTAAAGGEPTQAPEPTAEQAAEPAPTTEAAAEPTAPPESAKVVNSMGIELPADAAPIKQQVMVSQGEFGPWEHWADGWYGCKTPVLYAAMEQLLTIGVNNELIAIQAESWEANEDATEWTFHIRPGLEWSDGAPLNANDWVYTFQYIVNPEAGFDFGWFFAQIKNYNEITAGTAEIEDLGVSAPDDQTLVFSLNSSAPYWPALVASAFVLPKQAVEKCGAKVWSTDPACFVASGPFTLTRYERDRVLVLELNKNYKGNAKPLLNKIVHTYASATASSTNQGWTLYQNDEVAGLDMGGQPQNIKEQVLNDPAYADQLMMGLASKTTYITFDTSKPPFDDPKVREAFALAIDRETICDKVLMGTCKANYSFLPVNFPGFTEDMKAIQPYDPEKAKALMAEAGYPDGQGFPSITYYVRQDDLVAPEAIVGMWQENLGVSLTIEQFERGTFMQKMAAGNFQIYQLAYNADFPDPDNFLGLWISAAQRHTWNDPKYDELLNASRVETDPAKRTELINEAEKILLTQFGAIPLSTPVNMRLEKSWWMNDTKEASREGKNTSLYEAQWFQNIYLTKDAPATWPPVDPEFLK